MTVAGAQHQRPRWLVAVGMRHFNRLRTRGERYATAAAHETDATWCELDEGYRLAPAHAGVYILPALMAEAGLPRHLSVACARAR